MQNHLRPFWSKMFSFDWKFGLLLILLFGIPRFLLVLQANQSGGYGYVSIIFMIMWFTPLIFLTKEGRRNIGLRKPKEWRWVLLALFSGVVFCLALFLLSSQIYGLSIYNSFVYASQINAQSGDILESQRFITFLIASLVSMPFSPIGEEFLYRGVIHGSFATNLGDRKASYVDALAFAITHLAHFGVIFYNGKWEFFPLPALLWVVAMFVLSLVFTFFKRKSGSLLGAILCHAGYNIAMMYVIFYHIL